ncbi:MAG: CotH kinase family protein [Bacteroidales bacterium]
MHKYLIFFLLFQTTIGFSQEPGYYKCIISTGDYCKFIIPDQETVANWMDIDFNDSTWTDGINGIGYGDGDDSTEIAKGTMSVYIRFKFNLPDISLIRQMILDMDYDDGFAAYLNGTEIASANLNKPYSWDMLLDRDHEASLYRGLLPERWILGSSVISLLRTDEENVLAIEVHNVGPGSSDLSSNLFLHINFTEQQNGYREPVEWFIAPLTLYSHLPIVKIYTNGAEIPDEPKIPAEMEIIFTEGDTSSQYDVPNIYSGNIAIERRGESSSGFPKKQYSFETQTDSGAKYNVSLLGLPPENDWVLYAPYSDKSMLKNVLTYTLSRQMGNYAPRTRFVEVLLNGEYQGVYILIERIKQDRNRVDIAKLHPTDNKGDELTGGYLLRNDKTTNMEVYEYWNSPVTPPYGLRSLYQFYDPKYRNLTYEQRRYIVDFTTRFEETLTDVSFKDSIQGYRKYTDVLSFIDMMYINEMSMNVDCYHFSTYFFKDKDSDGGKFHSGPVWDYNLSWGNVNYGNVEADDGFIYTRGGRMYFWKRMMQDPWYANLAWSRWDELCESVLSWENIEHIIDSCVAELGPAIDRNYEKWPTLGTYIWPNVVWPDAYEDEIQLLKTFIVDRLPFLDSEWSGKGIPVVDYPPHLICKEDQYHQPVGINSYIAFKGELDPEFVWDDFNISSLNNNINNKSTLNGVTIPDGTSITWTAIDSKGQQASCTFNVYLSTNNTYNQAVTSYNFKLYPNPANDHFTIESNFPVKEIVIQTMDGRTVYHSTPESEMNIRINSGRFASGAYLVTVVSVNGYSKSTLQIINK